MSATLQTQTQPQTAAAATGVGFYARSALAGAIGCSVSHGVLTPVDVVKTRIQLDPQVYNKGMVGAYRQIVRSEGAAALMTGFGPTCAGYFLQGGLKFAGNEFWKKTIVGFVGQENAVNNRTAVYLVSSGIAELVADIALCPIEATRIRLVSQPTFATGLVSGLSRILKEDGVMRGFYSGFGPIVFKQVPYTMTKFAVFERVKEVILNGVGTPDKMTPLVLTSVDLTAGLIAGFASAIVSQPADTLLSKINKSSGSEPIMTRLVSLAKELGPRGLFTGLWARVVMVGTLTAIQFAIYGDLKKYLGATNSVEIRKI